MKKAMKKTLAVMLSLALSAGAAAGTAETVFAATGYTASGDNTHAITADGKTVSYDNITVSKTGDGEGDEADFYGENAAVFAANGAQLTISDADITTDGKYANAVFSYGEGTTINISDSTIKTSQRNSGGIMVTGGGNLNAENLTVETEGGSSATIRSDRGGGTMNVDGGSYTANGSGSPAVYSTADINVSNATLKSGSAQAVVVEGGNTVTLTDCDVTANNTVQNSDKSDYYQAVMLYQSMSGDAAGGNGSFTMNGGSLTSLNGGMFFVTNATYTINLSDVDITYADDELLRICAAGWGSTGSNGGQVTLNAENQDLEGTIIVDSISALNMYLSDGSEFTGTFENNGEVYVEISSDSSWTLTADCSITSLSCRAGSINLNGHTLTVGGKTYSADISSTGSAVEFTVSEANGHGNMETMQQKPGEGSMPEIPEEGNMPEMPGEMSNGQQPQSRPSKENAPEKPNDETVPEKPSEETVPEKPSGETVPEKPNEEGAMEKPEEGNISGIQPPEKPSEKTIPAKPNEETVPEKPNENSGMNKPENSSITNRQPREAVSQSRSNQNFFSFVKGLLT